MTTPAQHALRYRIHGYASPRGWDCTIPEIAEALGEPMPRVRNAIIAAKWNERVRVVGDKDGPTAYGSGMGNRRDADIIAAEFRAKMDAEE